MKKIFSSSVLIFLSMGFLIAPIRSEAAGASFSVIPVLPDNQLDKNKSYFELRMEPKKRQIIEVELTNGLDEEQIIEIESSVAKSNQNGIIEYRSSEDKSDSSLAILFPEIIDVENEVSVPANSTVKVPIEITMPDKKMDGIILGGLNFQVREDSSEGEKSQITNKFSYSIAVMISQNDTLVFPELKFKSIEVKQSNLRNVIVATIQNEKATIVENLELDASIYKGKQKEPIFHSKVEDFRMAPNSTLPFVIKTDNRPLKPGKYTLKMSAKTVEETWKWEEQFTIESDVAEKLNSTAVSLEKDNTILYLLIGISLISSLLLIVILLLIFKKKKRYEKIKK